MGGMVFFRNFSLQPNGNHSYGDLAKSGYQPDIKHKYLITLLYFWLQIENINIEIWEFLLFCLTYGDWKPSKITLFHQ